ncbi:competence protein ComK [Niallia sp. NCCP-28]|uniref:competence protein ComK n=1 Tax=Niallia sp. NCCP-28 TaxID=2934712 RepID=UPI002082C17C|nr:competence protein ComK [Niallia sp. NCCP-28]GKU81711.1 hypothetical protein NCCP28_11070 [Niallia sp. NCCP-28]
MVYISEISENYSINLLTLAIFPFTTKKGELFSEIYEGNQSIICSLPPKEIINRNCIELGCSYDGKKTGTRALMNYSYKVPIAIDAFSICLFPTHSPSHISCSWISVSPIVEVKKIGSLQTNIIFKNNVEITVSVSHHSITNQISRSNALLKKVNHNLEKKNSSSFFIKSEHKNKKGMEGEKCKEDNILYPEDYEEN